MPALMLDVHTDFSVDVGPPRRLMFQKRIAFKTGGLNRPSLQSQTSGERQFTSEESAPWQKRRTRWEYSSKPQQLSEQAFLPGENKLVIFLLISTLKADQ